MSVGNPIDWELEEQLDAMRRELAEIKLRKESPAVKEAWENYQKAKQRYEMIVMLTIERTE